MKWTWSLAGELWGDGGGGWQPWNSLWAAQQHSMLEKSCESYFNWQRFCIEAPPSEHLAVCAVSNLEAVARDFKCVCVRVYACVWEPPLKFNKDSEAPWFLAPHAGNTAGCQSGQPEPLTKSKRVPIGGGDWQQLCGWLNFVGSLSKRNLKNTIIFSWSC